VWRFVERWGRHRSEDLRTAVAVILVEDLFHAHFDLIFPRLVKLVRADPRFADAVAGCYGSGLPASQARRFARLEREATARAERWRDARRRRRALR
jgi:hypothetical protein